MFEFGRYIYIYIYYNILYIIIQPLSVKLWSHNATFVLQRLTVEIVDGCSWDMCMCALGLLGWVCSCMIVI